MNDRDWTAVHYPHERRGSLRFFCKLQYCMKYLYFNIIPKNCILFVVNGGELYGKCDLWFRRQWKISPNNWKVNPCARGTADGFKLFTGTCYFQFAAVDSSLQYRKQLLSALTLIECPCLYLRAFRGITWRCAAFNKLILYKNIHWHIDNISIHGVWYTSGRILGTCAMHKTKKELHKKQAS